MDNINIFSNSSKEEKVYEDLKYLLTHIDRDSSEVIGDYLLVMNQGMAILLLAKDWKNHDFIELLSFNGIKEKLIYHYVYQSVDGLIFDPYLGYKGLTLSKYLLEVKIKGDYEIICVPNTEPLKKYF